MANPLTYHLKLSLKRLLVLAVGLIFVASPNVASAKGYEDLSQSQLEKLGIYFINQDYSCGETPSSQRDTNPASTTGTWNSGAQPPYILEEFMIEVLKDVAAKRGVTPADTVTEEHVVALVAFAIGEGGDINNHDLFNPLNTGINAPDLLATEHNTSGVQSFKSFDAGVEANARVMTGKNQKRLSDTLIVPNSTAKDFMHALTYYQDYAGNKLWAEASEDPQDDPNHSLTKQVNYYNSRLNLVAQVRRDYAKLAGLVMGTPALEFKDGTTFPSKLQFHPGSAAPTTPTANPSETGVSCTCKSSGGGSAACATTANGIVEEALLLAWPDRSQCNGKKPCPGEHRADATPAYQLTEPSAKGAGFTSDSFDDPAFSDCGVFVATVMRASGADPSYPKRGTGVQLNYLRHSSRYTEIPHVKSTKDLQPGDILVTTEGTGHTYIYTGPQPTGKLTSAGASWGPGSSQGHVPEATAFYQDVDGQHFVGFHLISYGSSAGNDTGRDTNRGD